MEYIICFIFGIVFWTLIHTVLILWKVEDIQKTLKKHEKLH